MPQPFVCSELSFYCMFLSFLWQMFNTALRFFPLAIAIFLMGKLLTAQVQRFRIQRTWPDAKRLKAELRYVLLTQLIFSGVATLIVLLNRLELVHVYRYHTHPEPGYAVLCFVLLAFWHETFFYWTHRAMHHKKLFKHTHAVHHHSVNPSPFTSQSFHPIEALFQVGYLPLFLLVMPVPLEVILIESLITMILNLYFHSGYELAPRGFPSGVLTRWVNTSTHHNLHHSRAVGNYALYWNFWDRLCGTNHPDYERVFEQVVARRAGEKLPPRGSMEPSPEPSPELELTAASRSVPSQPG